MFETVKVKVVLTVQNNISFSNVRVMFLVSKLNNKLKKQGYISQIKTLLYKQIVEYQYALLNPTNIELLPIYLNGGGFIFTHLNSTDSLSKLSKIIFSADIL